MHVVDAHYADIVVVYASSQGLEDLFYWRRPVEVHETKVVLLELLDYVSCMICILGYTVIKLGDHGFAQNFIFNFEAAPQRWKSLR